MQVKTFKNERELQEDLAEHLRSVGLLTFTEIQIPSLPNARADIIAVKPHLYTNKDIRIYEVKNTRSAFLADHKYEKYLECCKRMYLACPAGVIKKDEVPDGVGLIVRGENGWRVIKAAKNRFNPEKIDTDFVWGLLYRGYEETLVQRELRDRINIQDNIKLSERAKNIGKDIARRLDRSKEAEVEEWCNECCEMFEDVMGIDIRGSLPDLYDLRRILESVSGVTNDITYIRRIGEYLSKLDLPEESKNKWQRSRKEKREKAMSFDKEVG